MINLKEETIEKIIFSNHSIDDVMFVGTIDGRYRTNIHKFLEMADFEYDDGFGNQEINDALIVFFKDGGFLERVEYDGAENWRFVSNKNFKETDNFIPLRKNMITGLYDAEDRKWYILK